MGALYFLIFMLAFFTVALIIEKIAEKLGIKL